MALNHLTSRTMVGLTAALVDGEHPDRQALDTVPAVATYMPVVEHAHDGVLSALRDPAAERLAAVSKEQTAVDGYHDTHARGVRYTLRGAIYWARDEAHADALRGVERVLFPDGLRVVGYSYREEAGHAASVAGNLTPAQKVLLAEIPAGDGTLLDRVGEWMEAGRQLGALEDERAGIGTLAVPRRMIDARRRWMRAIATLRGIVTSAEIEAPATAQTIAAILGRIDEAERRADRSSRGGIDDADDIDVGDDGGVDDDDGDVGDGDVGDDGDGGGAPGPDDGDLDPDGLDPVVASDGAAATGDVDAFAARLGALAAPADTPAATTADAFAAPTGPTRVIPSPRARRESAPPQS